MARMLYFTHEVLVWCGCDKIRKLGYLVLIQYLVRNASVVAMTSDSVLT